MLLVAGYHHPQFGLCYEEAVEIDALSEWIVRAADFLDRVAIFFIDGRIIDSSEFSPMVIHSTQAERLIKRLNTTL